MKRRRTNNAPAIVARIQALGKIEVQVGWQPSAVYEDGTPVAGVAAVQEFRDGGSRSFMRRTAGEKRTAWRDEFGKLATRVTDGKMTSQQLGDLIGGAVAGDIRRTISNIKSPELKKATLAARRKRGNSSEKPLVDERILINTLDFIAFEKGSK